MYSIYKVWENSVLNNNPFDFMVFLSFLKRLLIISSVNSTTGAQSLGMIIKVHI